MGGRTQNQKQDLGTEQKLTLDWSAQQAESSLRQLFDHATGLADEAINWYIDSRKSKKAWARNIRVLAIVLGAVAAILPTISELIQKDGKNVISAGWTTVALAIAGALLLLDRYFGFSTAWMRYVVAEMQIRQINQEFQMDWETERASWSGGTPSKDQINQMLARCKAFTTQINTIVREETNIWVQEFQNSIKYLDETIKAKPAVTEPGALNLTVTHNAAKVITGWDLIIDDGSPERYQGNTAGKRNMIPGKHQIKVKAIVDGSTMQAEKVVTIPAGGTCEETLTLS